MYTQLSLLLPYETMVRSHMPSARAGRNPNRGRRRRNPRRTWAKRRPGVLTASWEVTGVLYRGGVIKLPRARSARVLCPPQARKFWRC